MSQRTSSPFVVSDYSDVTKAGNRKKSDDKMGKSKPGNGALENGELENGESGPSRPGQCFANGPEALPIFRFSASTLLPFFPLLFFLVGMG